MVVIELAGSPAARVAAGIGTVLGGVGQYKQQQAEEARRQEEVKLAQRRMELMEAEHAGREKERDQLLRNRQAQMTQQELEFRGIGTPAGVQGTFEREVGQGLARGGGVGPQALAEAGAATIRRDQRMQDLQRVFSGMSPELQREALRQGQLAQREAAMQDYARGLLKKVRMMDRAQDVMQGTEEVLGPIADQIQSFVDNPGAMGPEGFRAVLAAEQAVEQLKEERIADQIRQQGADDIEQQLLSLAGENPAMKRLARTIATRNRYGDFETPAKALGAFLSEWSPQAFEAGKEASAQRAAQERMDRAYRDGARALSRRDPYTGETILPTREEIERYVALTAAPTAHQQQSPQSPGGSAAELGAAAAGGAVEDARQGQPVGSAPTGPSAAELGAAAAGGAVEDARQPKKRAGKLAQRDLDGMVEARRRGQLDPEVVNSLSDEDYERLKAAVKAAAKKKDGIRKSGPGAAGGGEFPDVMR